MRNEFIVVFGILCIASAAKAFVVMPNEIMLYSVHNGLRMGFSEKGHPEDTGPIMRIIREMGTNGTATSQYTAIDAMDALHYCQAFTYLATNAVWEKIKEDVTNDDPMEYAVALTGVWAMGQMVVAGCSAYALKVFQ